MRQDDKMFTISTDTRNYQTGEFFLAIQGKKFNPLDFVNPILEKGCPYLFYEHNEMNHKLVEKLRENFKKTEFVSVRSSVEFIQELAHYHMEEWKNKSDDHILFAISGSNGKTTHKEMLAHILSQVLEGQVVATEENNNNHLGVPLTLLKVKDQTKVVVLELGSNHPGEIKTLCDIAIPNAGLTTNIGATHLEFFFNEANVFKEESYLYHAVKNNTNGEGLFLLNLDDSYLRTLPLTKGTISFGHIKSHHPQAVVDVENMKIYYNNMAYTAFHPSVTGDHNKQNLLLCVLIASLLFPDQKEKFELAAKKFIPAQNRSQWLEVEGKSVFLDAYNANPSSMEIALKGFKDHLFKNHIDLKKACLILGDMNELGEKSAFYHESIGRYLKKLGFTHAYFIGKFASSYAKGFAGGDVIGSVQELRSDFKEKCLNKFPIHFVKGSRSLQLESLFDIN